MTTDDRKRDLIEVAERVTAKLNRIPDSDAVTLDKTDVRVLIAAVFEAAQKPTGDERGALAEIVERAWATWWNDDRSDAGDLGPMVADVVLASGFHRPVSPSPELGDLEEHLGRTSEGTALLPALWALAGVSPEPSARELLEAIYDPDEDDLDDSVRYGFIMEQAERLRVPLTAPKSQTEPTDALIEEALAWVGRAWDDGNGSGLDGWVGPGRGAGAVDREAQHSRTRLVHQAEAALRAAAETTNEDGSESHG